jgi:hypothetical protein
MSNKEGFINAGFVAFGTGERTLIDVTANGNFLTGTIAGPIPTLNVINSITCMNVLLDMLFLNVAQANTCAVSLLFAFGALPVCQYECEFASGQLSAADVTLLVEKEDETIAAVVKI